MYDEKRLIRRVRKNSDKSAADELIRNYYDEILRYTFRQTSDNETALDLTQDIFVSMLKTIARYDDKISSFRTWLYRIATYKIIDHHRSRSTALAKTLDLDDIDIPDETEFTRVLENKDLAERIQAHIGTYDAEIQQIFRLKIYGGINTMLIVDNVTKKYGNFTALEDISLEFRNGVYALLAPNGAGKTTLIKMLTTLIFPTKGQILWDGAEITKLDESYRDIIGYLPQVFGYYRNYSPLQFLMYLAALKGIDGKTAKIKALELLELVSLSDVVNKKMRKFSGGMIQRVGIAQAMLNNPKILILDEPTAGLDPRERVKFRNLISSLSKDRTVILSTHIVSDIETIANQVIMFKDHKLLCNDSPAALCDTLKGKVFETGDEAQAAGHIFLTERHEEGHAALRFVCDSEYTGEAKSVTPTLEDVFLYIYRDGAV